MRSPYIVIGKVSLSTLLLLFVCGYMAVRFTTEDANIQPGDSRQTCGESGTPRDGARVPNLAVTHYDQESGKSDSWLRKANSFVFNCTSKTILQRLTAPRVASFMPEDEAGAKEEPSKRKESFVKIFKEKIWKGQKEEENAEKLTGSGRGSTLKNSASARRIIANVIDYVKEFLGKERITMLDIPCGDLTWMPHVVANRADVDYTGMDIVPDLIKAHNEHYKDHKHMNFINGDIVTNGLNKESYDLIFTREMTQHLRTADGLRIFKKISNSSSEFLLATVVPTVKKNTEVEIVRKHETTGKDDFRRYREQNFELPPFNFPRPLCLGWDIDREHLGLWRLPLYKLPDV